MKQNHTCPMCRGLGRITVMSPSTGEPVRNQWVPITNLRPCPLGCAPASAPETAALVGRERRLKADDYGRATNGRATKRKAALEPRRRDQIHADHDTEWDDAAIHRLGDFYGIDFT